MAGSAGSGTEKRRRTSNRNPRKTQLAPRGGCPYTVRPRRFPMSLGATEDLSKTSAPAADPSADAEPALVLLSDKAASKIVEIRGEESIEDSYALRLKVQGGG